MAKRGKKRGANFGKKHGAKSSDVQKAREQRQAITYTLIGVAGVLVICLLLWVFSQGDLFSFGTTTNETDGFSETGDSLEIDDGGSASTTSTELPAYFDPIGAEQFELLAGDGAVAELETAERNNYYDDPFDMSIDTASTYEAVFKTEKGDMRFRLFDDRAPLTVNNFVNLAQAGFYDNTMFHRVLDNFMAQGGDPTGTGTGGPGYRFADEVDNDLTFDRRGLLAMANSGPATNGSQFFITFVPTSHLNGGHTIFGELIEGDDVLGSIDLRDPNRASEPGNLIETIEIYVTEG